MKVLRVTIVLLVVLEAGWITFDGARALRTGEYLKPRLGSYGGRVGEWTRLASVLGAPPGSTKAKAAQSHARSEEHTSELQSQSNLVCRLLLEKKKINAQEH